MPDGGVSSSSADCLAASVPTTPLAGHTTARFVHTRICPVIRDILSLRQPDT
jgi:hypothetical protein